MPILDIVFNEGDIQNFLIEVPIGSLNSPKDILLETNSNSGAICLETSLVANQQQEETPNIIVLNDGQLAKKVTNKFYLKL